MSSEETGIPLFSAYAVLLGSVFICGCSKPTLDDDLVRAKQCSTVAELELWLGKPTTIEQMRELEERQLPNGVTFTDSDEVSLGHGDYSVAVQSGKEVREYEHPTVADVRFFVISKDGRIEHIEITRRVRMVDGPDDAHELPIASESNG